MSGCGFAAFRRTEPKRAARVGFLDSTSPRVTAPNLDAFRQGMRGQGYEEGQDYVLESRHAEGRSERLPDLAVELVSLPVDLMLASTLIAVTAARNATTTIPIVFAATGDPVAAGLLASLARPGGNVIGLSSNTPELSGKRLELLKQAVPGLSRVAVLWNPSPGGAFAQVEVAAQALGVQILS